MEFSRQEYWSGLPCPPLGDFLGPGIELGSPALQVDSLPAEPQGWSFLESYCVCVCAHACVYVCVCSCARTCSVVKSRSTLRDPMDCTPPGSCLWNSPGKNTRAGCHALLQRIFLNQGSNLCLLVFCRDRWILYHCATWEAQKFTISPI